MSKRMIDSEVSERIKYRWDEDVEQSHIDIEADNVDVANYLNAAGISTTGAIEPAAIVMEIKGKYKSMTGRQVGNLPLYYHCVKLTSATKTVYVNLYSQAATQCKNILGFQLLVKGNQSLGNIEFYYGAGNSVVHFYKDSTGNHCMIDNEEVTGYEDHTFPIYVDSYCVL